MMFNLSKKQRVEILLRDKFRCQECDSSRNLQVHHRRYSDKFNPDDLVTLCSRCHGRTEKSRKLPISNYPLTGIVIESLGHIPPEPSEAHPAETDEADDFHQELTELIESGKLRVDAGGEVRKQ